MKGIILAGGSGTRLYPITRSTSKQLLPIYDKPMIYYPLSILMLAGIKEILIISTPYDLHRYRALFGTGQDIGLSFSYKEQPKPDGLAQAFVIGKDFIGNDDVALILGDNIFYGNELIDILSRVRENISKKNIASIFAYYVKNPQRYGIVGFNKDGSVNSIEEKPNNPKSNYAIVGLYFFPNSVIDIAKDVKKSSRGEYEITSIIDEYRAKKSLRVELLGRGYAWLDTGTHYSLLEASNFVQIVEQRQGLKIACIEEIAYRMGFIDKNKLSTLIQKLKNTQYGEYLKSILIESSYSTKRIQ